LGTDQTATVTAFDPESEDIIKVGEVQYWAVAADGEFQTETGINFALNGEVGDLTITDEQLAALGYVKG